MANYDPSGTYTVLKRIKHPDGTTDRVRSFDQAKKTAVETGYFLPGDTCKMAHLDPARIAFLVEVKNAIKPAETAVKGGK